MKWTPNQIIVLVINVLCFWTVIIPLVTLVYILFNGGIE